MRDTVTVPTFAIVEGLISRKDFTSANYWLGKIPDSGNGIKKIKHTYKNYLIQKKFENDVMHLLEARKLNNKKFDKLFK